MDEEITLQGGRRLRLRPITSADTPALVELGKRSSPEDLRLRFFSYVRPTEGPLADRLTHLDPRHEVALAAYDPEGPRAGDEILAVVRLVDRDEPAVAEFAIMVRSDLKRLGIGHELMRVMLRLAAARGLARVEGDVLAENRPMLALVRDLGGHVEPHGPSLGVLRVAFDLPPAAS